MPEDDITADIELEISFVIDKLDEKVSSMNQQRTTPSEIATAISSQMSGWFQSFAQFIIQDKKSAEKEGPRSIMEETLPVDIVSISPGAAQQITNEL